MTGSRLDAAHAAMRDAPEDDALRLAYFGAFADAELALLLEDVPAGNDIAPVTQSIGGVNFLLAFNGDDRLSEHVGGVAASAAVSGRALAEMLKGQDVGVIVDPGQPTETTLGPEALDWLLLTLATAPRSGAARPVMLRPGPVLPQALEAALGQKLQGAGQFAAEAWLALAEYDDGGQTALVAFIDAAPQAEAALAGAINEALTFSGVEGAVLDVVFAASGEALAERVARVGRQLPLTSPESRARPGPPGMDPARPPRLS